MQFKFRWLFAPVLFLAVASACEESPVDLPEATTVQVAPSSLSLFVGESGEVDAQVLDQRGRVLQDANVVWASASPEVARVSPNGQVTAMSAGTAEITGTYGGVTGVVTVTVSGAASLNTTPGSVQLQPGAWQSVTAQTFGAAGEQVNTTVTWESLNQGIATVNSTGQTVTIRAVTAGSTQVVAHALGQTDTVDVSVVQNASALLATLEIDADTIAMDVDDANRTIEFQAFDGSGNLQCDPNLNFESTTAVATGFVSGSCTIDINSQGVGETWVKASLNNAVDSVYVVVTDTDLRFSWNFAADSLHIVGDTVTYTYHVENEQGEPVSGVTFNFDVEAGHLLTESVVTDETGTASAQWVLPTTQQANVDFTANAYNSDGVLMNNWTWPTDVYADDAATVETFESDAWGTRFDDDPTDIQSLAMATDESETLHALAYDQYGNMLVGFGPNATDVAITVSNTDVLDVSSGGCSVQPGYCEDVDITALQAGTAELYISQNGVTDTIAVTVSEPAYLQSFGVFGYESDRVYVHRVDQTDVTEVYNGALPTHFPTFTATRDTVSFLAETAANVWEPATVAANGSESATPNLAIIPDSLNASAAWGFPVFAPAGSTRGNIYFLSDKAGVGAWNLYSVAAGTGDVTKHTANTDTLYTAYRGLSRAPNGNILLVTENNNQPGDSLDVYSNVYEYNGTTLTAITSNSSHDIEYTRAQYSPDGSAIYIDREMVDGHDLLRLEGGVVTRIVDNSFTELMPTFDPNDGSHLLYQEDDNLVLYDLAEDEEVFDYYPGALRAFSWSRR